MQHKYYKDNDIEFQVQKRKMETESSKFRKEINVLSSEKR